MGGVRDALGSLERDRRTGVLRVGDEGAFHVRRGFVAAAESRHARRLAGPEPELAALLTTFDAAYFLLGSSAEPDFVEGRAGTSPQRISVATLVHEHRRRSELLDAAWPDPRVDVAPVVPVRRVHRQRVILTGLQAEILLNADGTRTPSQLAGDLGRTAFACLLAVRGLAAASLLRTGPAEAGPAGTAPSARVEVPAGWAPPDQDLLARLRTALAELG